MAVVSANVQATCGTKMAISEFWSLFGQVKCVDIAQLSSYERPCGIIFEAPSNREVKFPNGDTLRNQPMERRRVGSPRFYWPVYIATGLGGAPVRRLPLSINVTSFEHQPIQDDKR